MNRIDCVAFSSPARDQSASFAYPPNSVTLSSDSQCFVHLAPQSMHVKNELVPSSADLVCIS
jgi:hypothetical protein